MDVPKCDSKIAVIAMLCTFSLSHGRHSVPGAWHSVTLPQHGGEKVYRLKDVPFGANVEAVLASKLPQHFGDHEYRVTWNEEISTSDGGASLEHEGSFSFGEGRKSTMYGFAKNAAQTTKIDAESHYEDGEIKTVDLHLWEKN